MKSLSFFEKYTSCSIIALFVSLAFVIFLDTRTSSIHKKRSLITVRVVGAVLEQTVSGTYNSTVDEILQKVRMLPEADVCEVDGSRKLCSDEILVIPHQGKITVYICGAVENPGVVILPLHATMSDLRTKIEFSKTADIKNFLRKKVLKNGSIVEVRVQQNKIANFSKKNTKVERGVE
jgi:hypothetical protein